MPIYPACMFAQEDTQPEHTPMYTARVFACINFCFVCFLRYTAPIHVHVARSCMSKKVRLLVFFFTKDHSFTPLFMCYSIYIDLIPQILILNLLMPLITLI